MSVHDFPNNPSRPYGTYSHTAFSPWYAQGESFKPEVTKAQLEAVCAELAELREQLKSKETP